MALTGRQARDAAVCGTVTKRERDARPKAQVSEKPWGQERAAKGHPTGLQRGLECSFLENSADNTGFHFVTNALLLIN